MRRRHVIVVATLAAAAALVACTLNPQPLPPRDNEATFGDAGRSADSGGFTTNPTPADASAGNADSDSAAPNANDDGGDAGGDAGDGGDAATDADAG
jgi:hypothetical protein